MLPLQAKNSRPKMAGFQFKITVLSSSKVHAKFQPWLSLPCTLSPLTVAQPNTERGTCTPGLFTHPFVHLVAVPQVKQAGLGLRPGRLSDDRQVHGLP